MKCVLALNVFVLIAISSCVANGLTIGTSYNNSLIWQGKAEYIGIPLIKIVKDVFYSDPGRQVIKGVIVREVEHTGAIASVSAGGIGYSYANIRLISERGRGLNYQIEIFV